MSLNFYPFLLNLKNSKYFYLTTKNISFVLQKKKLKMRLFLIFKLKFFIRDVSLFFKTIKLQQVLLFINYK